MSELTGPVHVVGAGLLGASIGLACRRAGLTVYLSDIRPDHVRTASGLGAGTPYDVAALVAHLMSPAGRHLSGQVLHVNGGALLAG